MAGFSHRTFLSGGAVVAAVGPRTPKGHAATEFERPLAIEAAKSASSAVLGHQGGANHPKAAKPRIDPLQAPRRPAFVSPCLATNPLAMQNHEIAYLIK